MDARALIDFLRVMERLKDAPRHCWTTGGRRESVAEHSWRVSLMAMLMADEFPEADIDKVIRMCLVHDIGEAITGDIPAFLKTDADRATEGREVDALIGGLPAPWPQTLGALFAEMDAQETLEAKLYKALDRMEAIQSHNESDVSTWLPLEYDLNLTYGEANAAFHPYLMRLRAEMRKDTEALIEAAEAKGIVPREG
ncbi:MAG: HD domain-containing protein [Clostridia bacterium]|nr:HD domain-containing protein [Clostridia bacterium]MBR1820465.1 HD domain-containing protein [Clostridia bacterium]